MKNFPEYISFTVTNSCNLRCEMCGQWSKEGYIRNKSVNSPQRRTMNLSDWIRLLDEISRHPLDHLLIRGGEPFLFPGIMDLLRYANRKGIFISLDTNGTLIAKHLSEIVNMGRMHITFSVDGPEAIHDTVRGVQGSFSKTKESIELLNQLDPGGRISRNICFVISPYSYRGLGEMPDVARSLGIKEVNIVPYYYVPDAVGKTYEEEIKSLNGEAFSWKGFHHEESGIDQEVFIEELKKYKKGLGDVKNGKFLPLSEHEYKVWFSDVLTPVGTTRCNNVENLMDIQPDGSVNFCIDYPDFTFGNALQSTLGEIWNSPRAEKFREYRRNKPLAVCYRCGAKYITEKKK